MADNNTLNFDLDAPAVPTLTLDPTPEAAEEKKPEPAPVAQQPEVQLTPEEQAMVDSFAEKIDITNSQQVLQYGSACRGCSGQGIHQGSGRGGRYDHQPHRGAEEL